MPMLDEKRYQHVAHDTFQTVLAAFDSIDSDDADVDSQGDVISIRFRNGTTVVLNTQRPTRQLWLAGGGRAWHFDFEPTRAVWLDDKGTGAELLGTLAELAREHAQLSLSFGAR